MALAGLSAPQVSVRGGGVSGRERERRERDRGRQGGRKHRDSLNCATSS